MASLVITTTRQQYIIPFETMDEAKTAQDLAIEAVRDERAFFVSNAFMSVYFARDSIETVQAVDHDKPAWLTVQQAALLAEQGKIRMKAESSIARTPGIL